MAARDLKVYLKTLSDASGLTKLGQYIKAHSALVRGLGATYKAAGAAGKAAFSLIGAELKFMRNAAIGGAGALAVAVKEGAALNIQLAQAVNMFGGNKLGNFVKFRTEILNLSSELGISSKAITEALYQAGSAQMAPDQSFLAIRKAAQGAVADGAELKDVMQGIIAGVKNFGGDVDQTAEQLYRIVQLGQTTFGEVGQYLNQVGPVAAANKVSLGEVGGAIAQLTSKTIPLSQSVVMLRNMMSRLNTILGDGWRESYTFQEAMEAVAKSVNYSQSAMGKLFGMEGMAGVSALVGSNFAEASKQAAEFNGQLNGLTQGAQFVDQFRGFGKIWETIRNYVKEIGSEIEQRWAPRIQFIAAKLEELRKGDGWKALVDSVSSKLESTVTWVIVQVKTAADLIEHLRSQDFGMARMAEVGKTVVVELITMAVTLLLALLKANMDVFIGMVKMVAAVFKKEIFDVLRMIPFLKQQVSKMAYDKTQKLSKEEGNELVKSLGFSSGREMANSKEFKSGSLDSAIAAFQSSQGVMDAMSEAGGKLKETLKDVDAQWQKSKANMAAAAGKASGGTFNYGEAAADNRSELDTFFNTPQNAAPASLLSRRVAPRKSRAQLERELEELQMQATAAQMDQDYASGQTPEEQRYAQFSQGKRGQNFAPNSFSARQEQQLSSAAEKSREEANKAAEEAAATLSSISGMMSTLVSGLKDLEGQMKNQP